MKYQVKLAGSSKQYEAAADESLLEAALFNDIHLPYGCQSGGCGACRARLVAGQIEYPYEPPALSPAEKAAGYILLCQAQARTAVTVAIEELPQDHAIPVRNMPVRVENRELLCHDVMQLRLKLPKGEAFEFLAGQYIDILMRDGRRRSFSMASPPELKGCIELQLRHVPGGDFTDQVFNSMPDRAILRLEGPLGNFYLREDSTRPILMLAGGTGIAPLWSILRHMQAKALRRPVKLFWGVRAQRDLYLHEALEAFAQDNPWFDYCPVLSDASADDNWPGAQGFVHEAVLEQVANIAAHEVYMSGPPVMIKAAQNSFTERGLPMTQLHYDSFDYAHETWPDRESGAQAST
ncbi:MAG: 2Fe-2S iron-sulfur cluster-binding protein [Nevskiales bacterium]